jgi:hypothetical protein
MHTQHGRVEQRRIEAVMVTILLDRGIVIESSGAEGISGCLTSRAIQLRQERTRHAIERQEK